jgi:peptide/nickel transport system permease protein
MKRNTWFKKRETISPGSIAWRNFRKNTVSLAALCIIFVAMILAITGYLITPDSTPHANLQILEIATQKPGFRVNILKVRKNEPVSKTSFLNKMISGKPSEFNWMPVKSVDFVEDKIELIEYDEFSDSGFVRRIHLADVVYPLTYDAPVVFEDGKFVTFTTADGEIHRESLTMLQRRILDRHLVKKTFYLGTDRYGRDMLSRLIIGARVSLSVGFIAVFISLLIGTTLGLAAGYFRGVTDNIILWLINVIWSIPTLLMVIAITLVLGKGFWQVFIAVGLTMWVEVARVVRGQVISIRETEYIEAARALGYSNFRIISRHVLPNAIDPVIVISAANFASAILIEAGLSFLGIGVQPPVPSWGSMIRDHYGFIIVDLAYLAIIPGLAIMLMVLSFTLVGNGLRDAYDPKNTN